MRMPQEERRWHQGNYGLKKKSQGRDETKEGQLLGSVSLGSPESLSQAL